MRRWFVYSLVFLLAVMFGSSYLGKEKGMRINLDLPYNAGAAEEDETAPELILFYGGLYETSAVVFCLDKSVSMTQFNRWKLQQKEITRAIMEITPRTDFGLVFYACGVHPYRPGLVEGTESNKSLAMGFIASQRLDACTCVGPGVVKSLKMLQNSRSEHRSVIVAGDGRPTSCGAKLSGPELINSVIRETLEANPEKKIKLHTIFVGNESDEKAVDFMRRLAQAHNGTFRMVTQ